MFMLSRTLILAKCVGQVIQHELVHEAGSDRVWTYWFSILLARQFFRIHSSYLLKFSFTTTSVLGCWQGGIYTIKVETIENNSHLKWTTLTPHRWPHTTGPKMVDRRKQLFLKCFHSKPPTFLTIALLCTHCTHLLISYGKPIS